MVRIILNVHDEQKAKRLLAFLGDLDYVDVAAETNEKVWKGNLPVFDDPISVGDFKTYTRDELHERSTNRG
jgi:hypothetical protein